MAVNGRAYRFAGTVGTNAASQKHRCIARFVVEPDAS